jgi:hypothetical protein
VGAKVTAKILYPKKGAKRGTEALFVPRFEQGRGQIANLPYIYVTQKSLGHKPFGRGIIEEPIANS